MKSHRQKLVATLLAFLPLVWGCAATSVSSVLPGAVGIASTGAVKAAKASHEITDSEEYYIGRAVAARVLSKYPLYNDPKVTEYVNEVGQTVARKSARPHTYKGYHFAVLDTNELNAFACPGGIIFITRGLLNTCANEDELAAVLAHECSHVANKDGINSISKARWTEVWTAMGTEAARQYGGVAGNLVTLFEGSIDDVFKTIVVNGYSRTAEEAADAGAVTTLSRAGYDSGALSATLKKMIAKEKGTSGGIFKTHPPTSERLAKVEAAGGKEKASPAEAKRAQRFKKAAKG
ncbi:MAG: M48 family metalloprotease [Deltaproteobacteria bacterium]|nr:M48 family metalloprotease [Deltaproteobacteria bacterium]